MTKKKSNVELAPKQELPVKKEPDFIITGQEKDMMPNPMASLRADIVDSNKTTPWDYAWTHAPEIPDWFETSISPSTEDWKEEIFFQWRTYFADQLLKRRK